MNPTVVIQTRMGSSRLPGKAMLPFDGKPALEHQINRAASVPGIKRENVLIATSQKPRDDVIEFTARDEGAAVYRGSETDVISRVANAVKQVNADFAVRLCGDNLIIDPDLPRTLLDSLDNSDVGYVSTKFDRTFPIGHNADAFTRNMISRAAQNAESSHHKEHVAQYFKSHQSQISGVNLTAEEVFGHKFVDSIPKLPELRLTLDESDDYRLLSRVYNEIAYDHILDTREAIRYIISNSLQSINSDVKQRVW